MVLLFSLKPSLTLRRQVPADVVIAADGVKSKARQAVLGYEDKPKSSGYAVWRAWYVPLPLPPQQV